MFYICMGKSIGRSWEMYEKFENPLEMKENESVLLCFVGNIIEPNGEFSGKPSLISSTGRKWQCSLGCRAPPIHSPFFSREISTEVGPNSRIIGTRISWVSFAETKNIETCGLWGSDIKMPAYHIHF